MKSLTGLHTVLITPFHADGSLDSDGMRLLIRRQLASGVDGIVVLGTTGEAPTLSNEESDLLMQLTAEELSGHDTAFIVGTGTYSTANTIEATRRAQQLGADAALIISPYYNKPTQEGIYRHFKAIAEAVDLPLIVYNNPPRTNRNIEIPTLLRLAGIPNIVATKETSGNLLQMADTLLALSEVRPDFLVLSGDDNLTFPLMCLGGHGVCSVASNLLPDQVKALVNATANGDWITARQLHFELLPLFNGLFIETNPIPIKTAMNLYNLSAGPCRLPLCEMQENTLVQLKEILSCCAQARV
jgi:4-hydroxy-tetrahydrodipicolinate synthase